jgi:secondary thiamine-phosphate synthase enzyme
MMTIQTATFHLKTKGFSDAHDITSTVQEFLSSSSLERGIATVFVPGSTAGITTMEFESGAIADLQSAIERIAPRDIEYSHDRRWGDGNGFAHVRAALLGPSLAVPFAGGKLQLGTWQQIILIDFDNRPRTREVHVQIVGE